MDHTRKLLLLLESDPKAVSLPLLGMYVGYFFFFDIHVVYLLQIQEPLGHSIHKCSWVTGLLNFSHYTCNNNNSIKNNNNYNNNYT